MLKKIVVASKNPVKQQAALRAFTRAFPGDEFSLHSCSVPSGVRDQPMSSMETYQGAHNRVQAARQVLPAADFWLGIEGGVEKELGSIFSFAWVCIYGAERWGQARSGTFALPEAIVELVRQGKELGEADDIVFQRSNSKQSNGAVGLLTNDRMNRTELYEHAILLALIPYLQPAFLNQTQGANQR
ncbi:MAG: inosine/xanthosine triphosphatase [Anaerolineae bacterium]|nr:inosine/xanthosine triphosphatase [Anaerolineae bacterium]